MSTSSTTAVSIPVLAVAIPSPLLAPRLNAAFAVHAFDASMPAGVAPEIAPQVRAPSLPAVNPR